jgi:hypothetical protein
MKQCYMAIFISATNLDTYNNDLHLSQGEVSWLAIPKKGQLAQAKSYFVKCIQKDKELNPSTVYENADIADTNLIRVLNISI